MKSSHSLKPVVSAIAGFFVAFLGICIPLFSVVSEEIAPGKNSHRQSFIAK